MDEETKKLLSENLALNKENNEMLHKLVVFKKWSQVYRIVYWSIIILSAVGAFYFIKPYLSSLFGLYGGGIDVSKIGNISDMTKNLGNNKEIQEMIKSLNN